MPPRQTVAFGTNSSATVNGTGVTITGASGDTITLAASASDSIHGSGATIAAGSGNTLSFAASVTDTVSGGGVTISAASGDVLTASSDTMIAASAYLRCTITGSSDAINAAPFHRASPAAATPSTPPLATC